MIVILVPSVTTAQDTRPKKIIYETDMCHDVDDVGALAVLHALADSGEAEILAVMYNEVHPDAPPAIDAINTWYGRGDIPIGVYKGVLDEPDGSKYLEHVAKFSHDLDHTNVPDALTVYRQVLAQQPDNSVTIVSVGFLNNLNDLLLAEPTLVATKVDELVQMGTSNFNIASHDLAWIAQSVFEQWPTPIVFSNGGGSILSGEALSDVPEANPVREGYYRYFDKSFRGRPSWDQLTVLYGVRGVGTMFEEVTDGTHSLPTGYVWNMTPGHRTLLTHRISDAAFLEIVEGLMTTPPAR
ncbi:MAG TPA: nucleoside hydrolase [Vicinamibacterales bacterium]|nr:nucleoside hydrolase [Vicinamibacterales bacterium]